MTFKTLIITAAASALMAGGAIAQDTGAGTTTDMTAPDTTQLAPEFNSINEMTVGDIVGRKVYEPGGDTIGKIDYIIKQADSVDAVIGVGGFLGLGAYTVAVPLNEFTYDASQKMVKLNTTKDALKERPEFDTTNVEGLPSETPLASLMESPDTSASPGIINDGTDGVTSGATPDDGSLSTGEETMPDDSPY